MKDYMLELLKLGLVAFVVGAALVAGMRVVEHGIAKPKLAIMVCFSDDVGKVEPCQPLDGKDPN